MAPHPWVVWDLKCALRAAALAAVALVIAWLLTAATDEGGVAWGVRLGRTLPAVPLCAAFGTWATLATRRARSERLTLEALGRSPQTNAAGAVAGAVAVAALAALALGLSPRVDASGYFPSVAHDGAFVFDEGAFVDTARALRYGADGSYARVDADRAEVRARAGEEALPRGGRAVAALVTFVGALAVALLAASGGRKGIATLGMLLAGVAPTLVLFHVASVVDGSAAAALAAALVSPCALLAFAAWRYRRTALSTGDRG